MLLRRLRLVNFRNYVDECFEFSPGVVQIIGDNAQGKTNLLESIYLLITGRSFRTRSLDDLIRDGQSSFIVEALFFKDGVEQNLRVGFDGERRLCVHNSTSSNSFVALLGLLQGVLAAPEDVALVSGAPALRRRFLDLHLAQIDPLYVHHLQRYQRALKQRNALLKARTLMAMDEWEEQLRVSGSYLTEQRRTALKELQPLAAEHMAVIGEEQIALELRTTGLKFDRQRELQMGYTLVGPHRDDLTLTVNERSARDFASQGQKVSAMVSLKLAEWDRLAGRIDEAPLLLLDDVSSHLSQLRRERLERYLERDAQVFVTSTEALSLGRGQIVTLSNASLSTASGI